MCVDLPRERTRTEARRTWLSQSGLPEIEAWLEALDLKFGNSYAYSGDAPGFRGTILERPIQTYGTRSEVMPPQIEGSRRGWADRVVDGVLIAAIGAAVITAVVWMLG
jgi:hypothetical protein